MFLRMITMETPEEITSEILKKISFQDEKYNLSILDKIFVLLDDLHKTKNTINDKFDLIFQQPEQLNDEYIKSHYLSIYRAILLINKSEYLVSCEIDSGIPRKIITQTIIYDIARFHNEIIYDAIKRKEKLMDESLRPVFKEIKNQIGSIHWFRTLYASTASISLLIWKLLVTIYTVSYLSYWKIFFNPSSTREKNKVDDIW